MTNEELASLIQGGRTDLLGALWEQIDLLIKRKAHRYSLLCQGQCEKAGVTWDDLYQIGYFAFLEALQRFDPDSGLAFVTYLTLPYRSEFRKLVGLRTSKRDALHMAASLEAPLKPDDDLPPLSHMLKDPSAEADMENVLNTLYQSSLRKTLETAIDTLPDTQQRVVRERYFENRQVVDIANQLGVSQSAASGLENKARLSLRRNSKLLALREDIISRNAYRGGLISWKCTNQSPQEKTAIQLEEKGLL